MQVFFLKDLQDLAQNLASLALKMKLFLQDLDQILQENYLTIFLARFLQDFSYLARKASFLVQDLQDFVQDLASLARKILARFGYFLQDGFYWDFTLFFINTTSTYIGVEDGLVGSHEMVGYSKAQ